MSDPIVGIDLGTSNTVIAHTDASGATAVLADANSYKIHPSVVSFHPSGGVVVGAPAKQRKVIDPKNTIFSVKRLIGRSFNSPEVQTARQRMPYQIKEGANQAPVVVTRGGEFAVPEISAIVLDHARNVASMALGREVSRAVVTVPASFNDAQRSATATAGSIGGLTIVRVLNEPTAAALAYGATRNLKETIAVYDFGGGTFDITILRLEDQVYSVLGTAGNTFLGGDDLDERLVDRMVEKFLVENRVDLRTNEVSMMRLRAVAEQTKIELSRRSRAVVRVDEIAYGPKGKPLDLQIEIRRDEFVGQVADIIDRTFPVCSEALNYAGLSVDDINDVILVGGTTKIPYVRDQVARFFNKAPRTDVNPEEAVAAGAALQATALQRVLRRRSSQVPAASFEEATDTKTFGGEDSSVTEVPVPQADLLELVPGAPGRAKRTTSGYEQVRRPNEAPERYTLKGQHHDKFEERTPATNPVVAPGAQPVIGRMTKTQPAKTSLGIPIVQMPPTPPSGKTTSPGVQAQRPPIPPAQRPQTGAMPPVRPQTGAMPTVRPPVPVAPPQAKTIVVDEIAHDQSARVIVDPLETAFSNIPTEQGTFELEPEPSPASTAQGLGAFAPARAATSQPLPPPPPAPPAQTMYGQAPGPQAFTPPPALPMMPAPAMPAPVVLDVTPRGLGIGTVAGFCEELIRRNSRVPAEIRKLFTTSRDDQDSVRIIVCQGESRRLDKNVVIGDLRLEGIPRRPRGETSIEVTFQLDASGILQVKARDAQTGREQRASLDLVGEMPQHEVDSARERVQSLRR
ncbi:MAG: Hsp70 family protein [Kofleriaceae bacterium]|nr:Hsp70 family protein [Kofleriaceae bacterium]